MESSATGSSSWTTRPGSPVGRIAMERPQCGLSLRNYAACRGGRGAEHPRGSRSKRTKNNALAVNGQTVEENEGLRPHIGNPAIQEEHLKRIEAELAAKAAPQGKSPTRPLEMERSPRGFTQSLTVTLDRRLRNEYCSSDPHRWSNLARGRLLPSPPASTSACPS